MVQNNNAAFSEDETLNLISILNSFAPELLPAFANWSANFIIPNDTDEDYYDETDETPSDAAKCDMTGNLIDNVLFYRCVLIPAFICIFILALSKKRTHLFLNLFKGRPGLVYPVNAMQGYDNTLPIVAGFIFLGWIMIQFISNKECASPFYLSDRIRNLGPFYALASYIIFAFIFYPIFASLTANSFVGYAVGTIYCWMLAPVMILDGVQRVKEDTIYQEIKAMQIAALMPPLICIMYLCVMFPYRLISIVCYERLKRSKTFNEKDIAYASHIIYVKELFKRHQKLVKKETFKEKLLSCSWIYKPVPGFKYSTSIIAAVSMGICFMYMIAVAALKKLYIVLETINRLLRRPKAALATINSVSTKILSYFPYFSDKKPKDINAIILREERFWFDVFQGCVYTAIILAFLCIVYALLLTLKSYRTHMLQIYSGSQGNIPRFSEMTPQKVVLNGVKYVGYQVAFAAQGYTIQMFFLLLVLLIPFSFIIAIIRYEWWFILKWLLEKFWATIVVLIFMKITQTIMVRFFFLMKDEHGKHVLAIDNRRLFFNFQFFAIFANIALGFVSACMRIIKGAIFGIVSIPRLDVSTISRQFERFDAGHTSYICMLYLEHIYRNPIMLTFVGILLQSKHLTTKVEVQQANIMALITGKKHRPTSYSETPSFRRAKIRWQVALTLINNDILLVMRKNAIKKKKLQEEYEKQNKLEEKENLKDRLQKKLDLIYGKHRNRIATEKV